MKPDDQAAQVGTLPERVSQRYSIGQDVPCVPGEHGQVGIDDRGMQVLRYVQRDHLQWFIAPDKDEAPEKGGRHIIGDRGTTGGAFRFQ